MKRISIKKHRVKSFVKETLDKKKKIEDLDTNVLHFNFSQKDTSQGQNYEDWEKNGLLSKLFESFQHYCSQTVAKSLGDNTEDCKNFKIYSDFPPSHKTDFKHPSYIPDDAKWCAIHLTNKEVIAGHLVQNIFYIVFLDREHRFWISEKKHT